MVPKSEQATIEEVIGQELMHKKTFSNTTPGDRGEMTARDIQVISGPNFNRFVEAVIAGQPVFGPRERGDQPGYYLFSRLQRAEDFAPGYKMTTLPPKKILAAPKEKLFSFTFDKPPRLNLHVDTSPFVLLGVHPCDLASIDALDQAYAQPPAEVRWSANRRRATSTVSTVSLLPTVSAPASARMVPASPATFSSPRAIMATW